MRSKKLAATSVTLSNDVRCKSCVVPRLFLQAVRHWQGPASSSALEELIERQCGECLDSCRVEQIGDVYHVDVAAREG